MLNMLDVINTTAFRARNVASLKGDLSLSYDVLGMAARQNLIHNIFSCLSGKFCFDHLSIRKEDIKFQVDFITINVNCVSVML